MYLSHHSFNLHYLEFRWIEKRRFAARRRKGGGIKTRRFDAWRRVGGIENRRFGARRRVGGDIWATASKEDLPTTT